MKISDMERKGEFDYDEVMNYYQMLLKKEKEAFEGEKQKKIKDVEYWARAVREEEKTAIEKYAKEHGEEEMKQIQKAVRERHEKELKLKQSLEKAHSTYLQFHTTVMQQRKEQHENQLLAFIAKKGTELQAKIVSEAKSELTKVENIRKVRDKEEADRKRMKEKEAKDRAEGKLPTDEDGGSGGWSRGAIQPVVSSGSKRDEKEGGGDGFLSRVAMGSNKPVEEKKDEGPKRPTFSKQVKKEDGGAPMTRAGFGSGAPTSSLVGSQSAPVKSEDKKDSTSDNQWRTTVASKPAGASNLGTSSSASTGFGKGSALSGTASTDKKPESSAGPWRSSGPQNNRGKK